MALSLKLLICLLSVASVTTESTSPTNTTISPANTTTTLASTTTTLASTTTTLASTTTTLANTTTTVAPLTPETTNDTSSTTTSEVTPTGNGTTSSTVSGATEPPTTPKPAGPCASNPCGRGSTCEERANNTYVCLCLAGNYYDDTLAQCVLAKVFPGELTYTKQEYVPEMENNTSPEFKAAAVEIISAIGAVFTGSSNYLGSTVTKLSPQKSKTTKATGVIATVDILFDKDSAVTTTEVTDTIEKVGHFKEKTLCESVPCDELTTNCTDKDGIFTCTCLDKYVPTDFSDRICAACPQNQKVVDGICKNCDFGYSGFNCEDQWQLTLVIVGSVLGALLLIMIIVLPVVVVNSKKKSKEKTTDYEKPYPNHAPAKPPQVSNGLAAGRPTPAQTNGLTGLGGNGVPRIPRATANENWDRNTNLEMVPSNSRQNLIPAGRNSRRFDDHDDSNPYSRPMKPQSNPYAAGRPQGNPYASSQGHSNPYYRH